MPQVGSLTPFLIIFINQAKIILILQASNIFALLQEEGATIPHPPKYALTRNVYVKVTSHFPHNELYIDKVYTDRLVCRYMRDPVNMQP